MRKNNPCKKVNHHINNQQLVKSKHITIANELKQYEKKPPTQLANPIQSTLLHQGKITKST